MAIDKELVALSAVIEALRSFDDDSRDRISATALAFLHGTKPGPTVGRPRKAKAGDAPLLEGQ